MDGTGYIKQIAFVIWKNLGINARDNKVKIRQEGFNLAYYYYFDMDGRILMRKKKSYKQ